MYFLHSLVICANDVECNLRSLVSDSYRNHFSVNYIAVMI